MKKEQKSFDKLLKEMNQLSEDNLGKLKGGIAVISSMNSSVLADNSGTCTNHGSCDDEINSGLCFNNKSDCPTK
ncbi:MAG: hypothetical protein COB60_04210 [Flavobacteriaceae bacterium]|nr:MAG: hypothetical protein COB60_04210 [Flavobacteriaceae bacterium]